MDEERVVGPGFHGKVFAVVRRIPAGSVSTYGDVGRALGSARIARQVGYALAAVRDDDVPWHRVLNARGEISPRESAALQRILLEQEGIEFDESGRVDLRRFRCNLLTSVPGRPSGDTSPA